MARVDLKADRANSKLLVHAAHLEPGHEAKAVAGPLREELRLMADWLGLEQRIAAARRSAGESHGQDAIRRVTRCSKEV